MISALDERDLRSMKGVQNANIVQSVIHVQAAALLETGDYEGIPKYICEYTKEFYKIMKERR